MDGFPCKMEQNPSKPVPSIFNQAHLKRTPMTSRPAVRIENKLAESPRASPLSRPLLGKEMQDGGSSRVPFRRSVAKPGARERKGRLKLVDVYKGVYVQTVGNGPNLGTPSNIDTIEGSLPMRLLELKTGGFQVSQKWLNISACFPQKALHLLAQPIAQNPWQW